MHIIWSAPAKYDLKAIFEFNLKVISKDKAFEIIDDIFKATEIFLLPNIDTKKNGQIELDLMNRPFEYRYLVSGHHKIIYFIDLENIIVTHVFDSRQNPQKKIKP